MSIKQKIKNGIHSVIMMMKEEKKVPITVPTGDDQKLKGKIALITGGSGGLGAAMAKEFIRCGAKVIIAGTKKDNLKSIADKIGRGTSSVRYILLNV